MDNIRDVVVENVNEGNDTVQSVLNTYSLIGVRNVENLLLVGAGNSLGTGNTLDNRMEGGNGNDKLSGLDGDDTLSGGIGNDVLNGGEGADNMTGGHGNDLYWVDLAGDIIAENANEGVDRVKTMLATYSLVGTPNVEDLVFVGTGDFVGTGNGLHNLIKGGDGADSLAGGDGNDKLSGLDGNDTLSGGIGNDVLNGGEGADNMTGGHGNDLYWVDLAGDIIVENANEGADRVKTMLATYSLVGTPNVEDLIFVGTGDFVGTGNGLNNLIKGGNGRDSLTGGDGDDRLGGLDGDDTLSGGNGDDVLNGGDGADNMTGGQGNDRYWVDNSFDSIIEDAGEGCDIIQTSVDYTLAGGSVIEFLYANTEEVGLSLTGNEFANTIFGGAGDDTIAGAGGADMVFGGVGADVFALLALADSTVDPAGQDTIGDFSALAGDLIGLAALDADSGTGGDQAFTFIGNAAFSAAGQVRAEVIGGMTVVSGNVNADLGADFAVRLNGSHALGGANFVL